MRIATIAATAALMAVPAFAQDVEFPARKPGQWTIEMVMDGAPAMSMQMCIDAASDKAMMEVGFSMGKEICPEMNAVRDGNTVTIDSVCKIGSMTTKGRVVMSGDYQSQYTVQMTSENKGGPEGMPPTSNMTQTATWTGDCADLKPGELLMPGGMKMNINDAMKGMGG